MVCTPEQAELEGAGIRLPSRGGGLPGPGDTGPGSQGAHMQLLLDAICTRKASHSSWSCGACLWDASLPLSP